MWVQGSTSPSHKDAWDVGDPTSNLACLWMVSRPPTLACSTPLLGARSALAQWRRGKHRPEYDYEEDCIGRTIKVAAGTSIEVVPSRLERDMQIVPINIEV